MYYLILKNKIVFQSKSYNKTLYYYNVIKKQYNKLKLQIVTEDKL